MNDIIVRAIKALRISQTMHAGPSREVDSIITEMEGLDLDAETKRADAAEAKVCELAEVLVRRTKETHIHHGPFSVMQCGICAPVIDAALDSTADIRAKWCPVSERDDALAKLAAAAAEDAGVAALEGIDEHESPAVLLRYWMGWEEPGDDARPLKLPLPGGVRWWCSGQGHDYSTVCAVVDALNEEEAWGKLDGYWSPQKRRFVENKGPAADNWRPSNRFPWPADEPRQEKGGE